MTIKEITIKNFRSYYSENRFEFSDGLTLLIGDNGDGKTTFFEALQWLFDTVNISTGNSIDNVSEMRKSEMSTGESDEVKVSMLFDHDGEKLIEKRFSFEMNPDGKFKPSPVTFRGFEEQGSERQPVDGKNLINRCFDAFIQRFSMFKGESTLDVFNDKSALKKLVENFSDIRKFDKLVIISSNMEKKSEKAYQKECTSDKRIAEQAKILKSQIQKVDDDISNKEQEIKEKEETISFFSAKIDDIEQHQETSERYKEICDRLENLKDKKAKKEGSVKSVDKNTALFDKLWILCAFPPILKEFKAKSATFSKEKRRQNDDFIKQKAMERGKLEAIKELCGTLENGASKLPWYLPDEETMEEMIHDHICKVCGRPAPEDSEAYRFMLAKLEEYKTHVANRKKKENEIEILEKKELFKANHIEKIHNLSMQLSGNREEEVSKIKDEINDRLDLETKLKQEIEEFKAKIEETQDEKTRLLIQSNVAEELLKKMFSDFKGMFVQKERAEISLATLQAEHKTLTEQKAQLHQKFDKLDPQSSQAKVYRDIHRTLEAIAKAFQNAKSENLRRFLGDLEDRANEYLNKLSANDFHGEIRLRQTADESTKIDLFSSNGTEIKSPSGSQKTVMYMSVLFAISDFTNMKRDENYPLIFDAATSSFGDSKEEQFYNVIDKLNKQCIIVTKDFITKGQLRLGDIDALTCSVYRLQKAAGFDERNMATIRTTIEKIK